ncbi:MAG: hypothetical protein NZ925_03100, partial [Sulfolobales archaeon]|nr:hypothetical protein [Sulfolobales archaeon]
MRYLLAALSAYASLSIALERVVPRALAECFLGIERDLLVAGEPFKVSLTLTSWLSPVVDVLGVELAGSEGVSVVNLKTSRRGASLRVDVVASARVGLHEISEVRVVARLKTYTTSLRFVVKVGASLRVVPRVDTAVVPPRAGVPYDVGLSLTGIAGSGTQFYGNREYRPG